jgi:hypothetical protein
VERQQSVWRFRLVEKAPQMCTALRAVKVEDARTTVSSQTSSVYEPQLTSPQHIRINRINQ